MASYNHTIDDADPVFKYYPYSDGDDAGGWAPYFAGSGGFRNIQNEPGDYATGQSLHYTAFSGSSVALEFHGTGVYLFGSANCTYDVTIDDSAVGTGLKSTTDVLFSSNGLSLGTHLLNLTVHASKQNQFALDNAVVTDNLPSGVDALVPVVYDNTNATLQYSGSWEVNSNYQIPSKAAPRPYHQTSVSMASVSLNFTGAAIAINGAQNWGHWTYNVILDGVQRQYNASTFWLVGDTQLFWESGLDPTESHHIEIINAAAAGMVMSLNDFTVYAPNTPSVSLASTSSSVPPSSTQSATYSTSISATSSSSSSKVSVGVIAGPVVAGVVLLVFIIAGLIWSRRHRRQEPIQDPPENMPAPYYADYPRPIVGEKSGQTVLLPPSISQPEQTYQGLHLAASSETAQGTLYPYSTYSADSRTQSRTHLLQSASPPTSVQGQQSVDVERIIELIAQRIDRPPPSSGEAPPQYPH
ncbi:hypothetical protein PHLGIDRAFT_85480 [Phlebiopsis gigantea 11061_1 CR5-6]|uniref:Transmembrane protein n=1 Tax=Phlebiopsis gigantea (strain 11061_1 CR5-6) TaxID=745531 RepID=A0A0C3SBI7_PHLG1|nr:hypothetical protein PHLGIDRAFT_85480 [Phlebiopsis gigantea 11061_1 CR5-6]